MDIDALRVPWVDVSNDSLAAFVHTISQIEAAEVFLLNSIILFPFRTSMIEMGIFEGRE
jgi:hypothetical protein